MLDGGGTSAPLLTMNSGAKFSFDLGTASTSDRLNVWNYSTGDLVLSANAVNLTLDASIQSGSYTFTLFNFYTNNGSTLSADTFSGLALGTLSSNISSATFDYSSTGQIKLKRDGGSRAGLDRSARQRPAPRDDDAPSPPGLIGRDEFSPPCSRLLPASRAFSFS